MPSHRGERKPLGEKDMPACSERGTLLAYSMLTFYDAVGVVVGGRQLPRPRLLIVDDDADFVACLAECLEASYSIVAAYSATEAMRLVRKNRIAGVLLDVVLPGESGIDILTKMKAARRDLPVIIMTGHGSEEVAVQALRGRADDLRAKGSEH